MIGDSFVDMLADASNDQRLIRSETRARLVEGIAKARAWLHELVTGRVASTADVAEREGCTERSVRMALSLSFLGPELTQAAIDGRLPRTIGVSTFTDLPASWRRQAELLPQTHWGN